MVNPEKNQATDKIKIKLNNAKTKATKAGKSAAGKAKVIADATKVALSKLVSDIAKKLRTTMDKAHELKRQDAVQNLTRLRKLAPTASPAEILSILEVEFKKSETAKTPESDAFVTKVAAYVFTAVEVHGTHIANAQQRKLLLDTVVFADSAALKLIAKYGGGVIALLSVKFKFLAPVVKLVGKAGAGVVVVKGIASSAGIKYIPADNAATVVIKATNMILGTPPATWPVARTTPKKSDSK